MSMMPPRKFYYVTQNYIADVAASPKLGNSSVFMRDVIITSILQGIEQKKFIQIKCRTKISISRSSHLKLSVIMYLKSQRQGFKKLSGTTV